MLIRHTSARIQRTSDLIAGCDIHVERTSLETNANTRWSAKAQITMNLSQYFVKLYLKTVRRDFSRGCILVLETVCQIIERGTDCWICGLKIGK